MQKKLPQVYLFVDEFSPKEFDKIDKNISFIYRNYKKKVNESTLISLKNYCAANKRRLYLAKDIKLAINLKLHGVYIPAFVKQINFNQFSVPNNFSILGSAHNKIELKIKIKQGCSLIFLAPTFRVPKKNNYLGLSRFNLLALNENSNFIALGGINEKNYKKTKLLNCLGFAGITWIKKNGPTKIGPFFK
tara:strand:+ start:34 stop:603 length:570 start_codon:yes stop_codon:yes gene_type:complete